MRSFPSIRSRVGALGLAAVASLVACGGEPDATPPPAASLTGAAAEFHALGVKGTDATARVTFAVTTSDGDSSEIVVAQDPPLRSFRVTEGQVSLIIATEGGDVVTCGESDCYRIPGLGSSLGAAAAGFLGPLGEGFDAFRDDALRDDGGLPGFESKPQRTIAGRDAVCGAWNPSFSPGGFELCLDVETGVGMSYVIVAEETTVSLEAITFEAPSEQDFEAPFPVTDLPTGYVPPTG